MAGVMKSQKNVQPTLKISNPISFWSDIFSGQFLNVIIKT
jgi:hypothetical protein